MNVQAVESRKGRYVLAQGGVNALYGMNGTLGWPTWYQRAEIRSRIFFAVSLPELNADA